MSATDEVRATEKRLKDVICLHAPTVFAGTTIWAAAHAWAKAMQKAERERVLRELQTPESAA